jgi:hypothetical protein
MALPMGILPAQHVGKTPALLYYFFQQYPCRISRDSAGSKNRKPADPRFLEENALFCPDYFPTLFNFHQRMRSVPSRVPTRAADHFPRSLFSLVENLRFPRVFRESATFSKGYMGCFLGNSLRS